MLHRRISSLAVVKTPDTDIFLILLHHATSILKGVFLDNGLGKQRRLINVSEIAREKGPNYCTTLLGIYIYTGEDATSASKCKGKIGPLKRIHLSFILFSKVSEKNGQLLMRFAAKFRHLQVLCLDIQGKENKYSTRKGAEKNG